ncbi:sigma-54-dependent transcriptional regulator [Candidatus Entotheonella palauensis]|uniref:sigma-54-dependent transcriptional regulator n=1 Tax=Candidatus Entotheonella palauensis TaxID=93172 RepID=UPI000B7EE74F|nr:sigma-54 dependent transcriptional regulator [Candidatus Entotheonella palauensis]
MAAKVLVVDDEIEMTSMLRNYLTREGYEVETTNSAEAALECLEDHEADVVLTDLRMGEMDGMDLVRAVHASRPETQIILMTAFGGVETAIEAIKAGAFHFVAKPVKLPEVGVLLTKALAERDLRHENRQLRQAVKERYSFGQLLGKSASMQRMFALLERLATTQSTVLIQGESGTGKELVARALHLNGPRSRHPFVPVNCAAMPEGLLESELFGHVKGAFTGAEIARKGLFQEAAKGTIFLNEIGEMPWGMQAKLLRVLEQRQIRPVGSDREVDADVRVLAATNRRLEAEVQKGNFREDLYYRLKVMMVRVPPLREHPEDIPFLADTFLQRYTAEMKVGPRRFTRETLNCLETYSWPGNVRELSHVIERAVTLCDEEWIREADLGLETDPGALAGAPGWPPTLAMTEDASNLNLDQVTERLVIAALERSHGHKGRAAALLGVHPRTLTRMMRRYSIPEDADAEGG